jgi:pyruvate/2-oxoacid:ferredoxin oxidoreductase alpha subunit
MAVKKFFKILSIEFSDLEEGIDSLISAIAERYKEHDITEHVMLENSSLLKRELKDMLLIHKEIMNLSEENYSSIEEASIAVIKVIYSFHGIPKAVHTYMEGRVKKVLRYMEEVC